MEEVADGSAGKSAGIAVGDILRGTTARTQVSNIPDQHLPTAGRLSETEEDLFESRARSSGQIC